VKTKNAFTLVEILIVIGIIAIVAAILFPVLANSKKKSLSAKCQSNLRQIGIMISMYKQDYDGAYPNGNAFRDVLRPKINTNKLQCPTALITKKFPDIPEYNRDFTGYGFNVRLVSRYCEDMNDPCEGAVMDSTVVYPAVTVYSMDQAQEDDYSTGPNMSVINDPHPVYKEEGWRRHNGGANVLFCDGHVKWLMDTQIQPAVPRVGGENINDGTKPTFAIKTK
jgi:prepilin-type processing-associated H-X9-DG protein/prepilin-type N-terminal cleavage/methylation domain-containing protein